MHANERQCRHVSAFLAPCFMARDLRVLPEDAELWSLSARVLAQECSRALLCTA